MFNNRSIPRGAQPVDTLIGPQVTIRGDVIFSGGLYVEGQIHGSVRVEEGASGVVTLAEQGGIEGEIHAPVVVINGRLEGNVHASERVELAAMARVHGDVHYAVVEMRAGAQLTGRLIHADAKESGAAVA